MRTEWKKAKRIYHQKVLTCMHVPTFLKPYVDCIHTGSIHTKTVSFWTAIELAEQLGEHDIYFMQGGNLVITFVLPSNITVYLSTSEAERFLVQYLSVDCEFEEVQNVTIDKNIICKRRIA